MKILQTTPTYNNSFKTSRNLGNSNYYSNTSFEKAIVEPKSKFFDSFKKLLKPITEPYKKGYDNLINKMAEGFGGILRSNKFKKLMEKAKNKTVQNITVLGSFILSGFYVKQTLQNDKLEKQRKITLAINQSAVFVVSTIASYTIDNLLTKPIDKFVNRYIAANVENPKIGKYADGIKCALPLIIFGTMYRFIAPVLITPIANHLGNKLYSKNEDLAAKQKNNQTGN